MGNNVCTSRCEEITKQDIQGVLSRVYDIMTSDEGYIHRVKCIEELVHRYRHLTDPHYIYRMIPMKSPDGLESLLLQGTVGKYAIDMYLFYDTISWQALIYPAPYRSYTKNINWLPGSITVRKARNEESSSIYDSTSSIIDRRYREHDYYTGYASITDIRFTPSVEIVSPTDSISAYDTTFELCLSFRCFTLENGRYYTVQVNDGTPVIVDREDPIQVNVKEGSEDVIIRVVLYNENKMDVGYATTVLDRSYTMVDITDQLCESTSSIIVD